MNKNPKEFNDSEWNDWECIEQSGTWIAERTKYDEDHRIEIRETNNGWRLTRDAKDPSQDAYDDVRKGIDGIEDKDKIFDLGKIEARKVNK